MRNPSQSTPLSVYLLMHLTGIEIDDVLIGVIIYYIQMAFPALGRNLPSFEVPLVESGSIGEDTPCSIMKQLALEYTVKDYSRVPEYKGGRTNTAWGSCAMLSYRCGWVCLRHCVEDRQRQADPWCSLVYWVLGPGETLLQRKEGGLYESWCSVSNEEPLGNLD